MPTISVIVPVYKVEKYIHRCVDSILSQTFQDFELILVDDGSPDNSGAICDDYAAKDSRVRVIHKENGGLSAARNTGIDWVFDHSDSQWLTFIDSDDWVHSEYLERLLCAAVENNVSVSVCNFIEVNEENIDFNYSILEAERWENQAFFQEKPILATIAWGKLYRRGIFTMLRYPAGKIHEDEFVTYKALFSEKFLSYINAPLYFYFNNSTSITRSAWSLKRLDAIAAIEERIDFFEKISKPEMAKYAKLQLISRIAWLNLQSYAAREHRNFPTKYKMGFFRAAYLLEKTNGTNRYESIMAKMFPQFVIMQARGRKIMSIVSGRKMKKEGML